MSGSYRQHDYAAGNVLLCRWVFDQGADTAPVTVVPDACVDLLWDGVRLSIAGPDRTAQQARLAAGTRLQGLRFAPAVASRWLGMPLQALADQRIDLRDLGIPHVARVADRMAAHAPDAAMRWLADHLLAGERYRDDAMQYVHARLSTTQAPSIRQLADDVGMTERTLLRRCEDAFGYGPKRLARILRLQRFLGCRRRHGTLLDAALEAGYYDAAQLSGDVRKLTGMTPTRLVAQLAD